MDFLTDVENPRYSLKTPCLRLRVFSKNGKNFFSIRNFDTEFEISFVSTMDISTYTQSDQARIAEKHLTRLAENGMAAATYKFW